MCPARCDPLVRPEPRGFRVCAVARSAGGPTWGRARASRRGTCAWPGGVASWRPSWPGWHRTFVPQLGGSPNSASILFVLCGSRTCTLDGRRLWRPASPCNPSCSRQQQELPLSPLGTPPGDHCAGIYHTTPELARHSFPCAPTFRRGHPPPPRAHAPVNEWPLWSAPRGSTGHQTRRWAPARACRRRRPALAPPPPIGPT